MVSSLRACRYSTTTRRMRAPRTGYGDAEVRSPVNDVPEIGMRTLLKPWKRGFWPGSFDMRPSQMP